MEKNIRIPHINQNTVVFARKYIQRQKTRSFVPRTKMNVQTGFYAWFLLWFINIETVKFYKWALIIRYYTISFLIRHYAMLLSSANSVFP